MIFNVANSLLSLHVETLSVVSDGVRGCMDI